MRLQYNFHCAMQTFLSIFITEAIILTPLVNKCLYSVAESWERTHPDPLSSANKDALAKIGGAINYLTLAIIPTPS